MINIDLVVSHSEIKHFPLSCVSACGGKPSKEEASLHLSSKYLVQLVSPEPGGSEQAFKCLLLKSSIRS